MTIYVYRRGTTHPKRLGGYQDLHFVALAPTVCGIEWRIHSLVFSNVSQTAVVMASSPRSSRSLCRSIRRIYCKACDRHHRRTDQCEQVQYSVGEVVRVFLGSFCVDQPEDRTRTDGNRAAKKWRYHTRTTQRSQCCL